MGAVAVRDGIYESIVEAASSGGIELFHGYTYSAAPVAVAAALAALEIYRKEGLFDRAGKMAPLFLDMIFSLQELPNVIDIRGYGMIAGIDLAPKDNTPGKAGQAAFLGLYEAGLLSKVTGDTLLFAPPLVAEESHLDAMAEKVRSVLGAG